MKKSMMFGLMCAATFVCGVAKGETVTIPLEVGCDTLAYSVNGGLAVEVDLTGEAYADATALEFDLGHNGAYVVELKKSGSTVKTYNWNVTGESCEVAAESEENEAMLDTRGERSIDCRGGAVLETFTYSGIGWGEQGAGTSATVTFKKDGGNEQTLLDATEGAGEVQWTVERGGKYVFTHKSGDAEETATFVVNGPFTVRVPKSISHLTCAVFVDETPVVGEEGGQFVLYEIRGSGCTIVFTPTDGYLIRSGGELALPVRDKTLGDDDLPVLIAPGEEDNPWKIGEGGTDVVQAYVKGDVLVIAGSGAMADFASAASVPWAAVADEVTEVTIAEGVTKIGKNALAGMNELATVNGENVQSTYRTVSTVNGKTIEQFNMMADALGNAKLVYPPETPPAPVPPAGAVTSWDALTNAVATVASGVEIAVGADITEAGGELVVPAGKAVMIKLYGNTVSCGRVTVGGALMVGDAEDSVGRIIASNGAKVAKGGSVTLLGGPLRGTFTTLSPGLILLFR